MPSSPLLFMCCLTPSSHQGKPFHLFPRSHPTPSSSGIIVGAKGPSHVVRGLELLIHPPWPPGRGAGLEVESINHDLCNEASIKTPKGLGVLRVSRLVNMWWYGQGRRGCTWWEHGSPQPLSPHLPCPIHLSHLTVLEFYPSMINWQSIK